MSNAPMEREALPKHTQDEMRRILDKRSAEGCSEDEIAFLNARRDYLTSDEVAAFGLDSAGEAKPAKKSKKAAEAKEVEASE